MDDARFRRLIRSVPAAAIAVPVLWAVVAHAVGSSPRPMAAAPPRPALAFAQRLVDLGEVAPSEEVFAHFDFTNRGTDTVRIDELVGSCGCLQPELRKKIYHPKQSGQFLVRVQTANQSAGSKEYHVTVKYHDPDPRETDVVFRVVFPENQVFIRPRALEVMNLGSSEATTRQIEVVDRRTEPLSIARIECTLSGLVTIGPVTTRVDEQGHTHHLFDVTVPGNLPETRSEAMLRIFTDDSDYRALRLPLRIDSRRPRSMAGNARSIVDPAVRPASATSDDDSNDAPDDVHDEPDDERGSSPR
ncbi:MAG: DUF1573 domain-containing protein [Planctomycetaceae bacterium]|nr:DUF1573 domain-containing protein [Planctomycetaceae bacterium]